MSKAIQFRSHAKEQLKERNIPEDLVKDVIRHPGQVVESYKSRKVAQDIVEYKNEQFLIRVVYEEKRSMLEVITVYLTKKVKKYWEDKNEN